MTSMEADLDRSSISELGSSDFGASKLRFGASMEALMKLPWKLHFSMLILLYFIYFCFDEEDRIKDDKLKFWGFFIII